MFDYLRKRSLLEINFASTSIGGRLDRRSLTRLLGALSLEAFPSLARHRLVQLGVGVVFFLLLGQVCAGADLGYQSLHPRERRVGVGRELIGSHLSNYMGHIAIN